MKKLILAIGLVGFTCLVTNAQSAAMLSTDAMSAAGMPVTKCVFALINVRAAVKDMSVTAIDIPKLEDEQFKIGFTDRYDVLLKMKSTPSSANLLQLLNVFGNAGYNVESTTSVVSGTEILSTYTLSKVSQ